jgi:hypothetical protein
MTSRAVQKKDVDIGALPKKGRMPIANERRE